MMNITYDLGIISVIQYNSMRKASPFSILNIRSLFNGLKSLLYLVPKIWNIELSEWQDLTTICAFKNAIKY